MTTERENPAATNDDGSSKAQTDVTGRDRIFSNVLFSWAGHLVFIVAGFILPRMIDAYAGQEALGVWDFSWSLVAYFGLVQGGIVSSINRYVAKYRAVGDMAGVNRAVSSVSVILALMALAIVILSLVAALLLPDFFGKRLGSHTSEACWVVFLLGSSLAVQVLFSGYGGVVTGCHRWGLHNAIYAATHFVIVSAMIVTLSMGGGLRELALINLIGETCGRLVRCVVAYHVCPGLRVRVSQACWSEGRSMLGFGGKSFMPDIGALLLNQTTSVLVLAYLGPAMLAVYSRPRALVRHVNTLVSKFSFVLTPTASSLQATSRDEDLHELLVGSARWGAYIALPIIVALAILGGPILRLWMGPAYQAEGTILLLVLALGNLASIIGTTVFNVLVGMNAHGRAGLATLVASMFGVVLTVVALGPLGGGLVAVAFAVTVPLTIAHGYYVPMYACRRLGIPVGSFLINTLRGPVLCCLPFAACLAVERVLLIDRPGLVLLSAMITGLIVLGPVYWCFALSGSLKRRLADRLGLSRDLAEAVSDG